MIWICANIPYLRAQRYGFLFEYQNFSSLFIDFMKPFFHFDLPLALVWEVFVVSPAMSADGIEVHGCENAVIHHRCIIVHTVANGHALVIAAVHDEGRRCLFIHLQFVGIKLHQVFPAACGLQLRHVGSSPPPRDRTFASCVGSAES